LVGIDWVSEPIYGGKDCVPIPADYDGDGMLDLSVVGEDGTWRIDYSHNLYSGWDWSARMSIRTSVAEHPRILSERVAMDFRLAAFPNPSTGHMTLEFYLPVAEQVSVRVYNLLGQEVANLATEVLPPGPHRITWVPGEVANGCYLCRFITREGTKTAKLLLLR
jgi:hypothetical protein